jgi:hypothetical protein
MSSLCSHGRWALLLLLVLAAFGSGGCATNPESENLSARPWNAPQSGYEYGVPGAMYDRYR